VYLASTPAGARLGDVKVETSVRRGRLTVGARLDGLEARGRYRLAARVTSGDATVREFEGVPFAATDVADGRVSVSADWKPDRLWDLDRPQNTYDVQVSLLDGAGRVLDTASPVRFGFRELWIEGRDFYLNGTRLFLSAVPLDNAQIGAASANYAAARETFERLKRIGINCVYTHNYDCTPGAHLSFEEVLRAADDAGVLVALSQPHFSQYDWKAGDADAANGYARDAAFYVRVAQNHPSVVFYATSHNATGYDGDMDPDGIDGVSEPRDRWSSNNAKLALRAEAIVRRLDPTRIVYHHAGGNTGSVYTVNFYPNFAPAQELSDWFGHWASAGTKPLFLCEYGAPFTWDWAMYRGWYQGKREFGSAAVPWEFRLAEWDAQFLGDRAFPPGDAEKANLGWEAKQFAGGKGWHRWDYPTALGSAAFERRNEVLAQYLTDNWRAFRTLGVSGVSPWEYEVYWRPRPGVDRRRKDLPTDWDGLQRPGFSPDYVEAPVERIDTAYAFEDWQPTPAGEALLRNNQPVLAYVAGRASAVTGKDHNFRAGEAVEKQLVVVNNSRRPATFRCEWSLDLSPPAKGRADVKVETGQQARVPLRFDLPPALASGKYLLRVAVRWGDGNEQADTFTLHVVAAPAPPDTQGRLALYDPRGETAANLQRLGVTARRLAEGEAPSPDEVLVVGKMALTPDGPGPDLSRVRAGGRAVVFEQSRDVLEKRLGFRAVEYGLRRVFPRIADHPALAGVGAEHLADWRGEATTVPPRLGAEVRPQHGPTVQWCGIPVSRVWRCGSRGSVASVLVEKPASGDFRPVLDGGFGLQYSPLMECREGSGMILLCQLDVTGRTEADPVADALVCNLLRYVVDFKPQPSRRAVYLGGPDGKRYFESAGVAVADVERTELNVDRDVLLLAPGAAAKAEEPSRVTWFLEAGGRAVAVGLGADDAGAVLPFKVTFRRAEYVGAALEPQSANSPLAGVGPADLYNRCPRDLPLVASGATVLGDGVLALAPQGAAHPKVIFCQLAPWQFDATHDRSQKAARRRSAVLLGRLLANLGAAGETPLPDRFQKPPAPDEQPRWLRGLYSDVPEEWDDPYRFFRW
jgi:hypothetical protein